MSGQNGRHVDLASYRKVECPVCGCDVYRQETLIGHLVHRLAVNDATKDIFSPLGFRLVCHKCGRPQELEDRNGKADPQARP
jgi:rRNA maturation endonuclease Nob1